MELKWRQVGAVSTLGVAKTACRIEARSKGLPPGSRRNSDSPLPTQPVLPLSLAITGGEGAADAASVQIYHLAV